MVSKSKTSNTEFDTTTAIVPAESDKLSTSDVISALTGGANTSDWEVVVSGMDGAYWAAAKGSICHGIVRTRNEINTRIGKAAIYSVELLSPCDGVTADGEVQQIQPGSVITVLERKMLQDLAKCVGREVAICCDGKTETKGGQWLWTYRVMAKRVNIAPRPATATP